MNVMENTMQDTFSTIVPDFHIPEKWKSQKEDQGADGIEVV